MNAALADSGFDRSVRWRRPCYGRLGKLTVLRRGIVRLARAILGAALGCMVLTSPRALADASDDSPLAPLAEFRSEHGVLTATLEARDTQISIGRVLIDGSCSRLSKSA